MAESRYYLGTSTEAFRKYPRVETFSDLPSASGNAGRIYLVEETTGGLFNKKRAGLYRSDGTSWVFMGTEAYVKEESDARYAQVANNLSDLDDAAAARSNINAPSVGQTIALSIALGG